MRHTITLILSLCFTAILSAQNTPPVEESKSLSDAKQRVIVRFEQQVASINSSIDENVKIIAAEFLCIGDNSREYSVIVDITQQVTSSSKRKSRVSVAYDELEPLISAFSVLQSIDKSASSLPHYAGFYRTNGDFEIRAFMNGRQVSFEIADISIGGAQLSMNAIRFAEIARALQSAKDILDGILVNK